MPLVHRVITRNLGSDNGSCPAGGIDLILDQFGLPAEDITAAAGVDELLDDPAFTADVLRSLTLPGLHQHLASLGQGICVDSHSQARHLIYFWKMLLRDTLSEELAHPELILQPTGDDVIDGITLYGRLDISHQPLRLTSWERLTGAHHSTVHAAGNLKLSFFRPDSN